MAQVFYWKGFKYQLREPYTIELPWAIWPDDDIQTPFIHVCAAGAMTIRAGYAWNGASGTVIDRKSTKRGSLVHDALYQLMRMELLPQSCRIPADELFGEICREDGVWGWLASLYVAGLKRLGDSSADPDQARKLLSAP